MRISLEVQYWLTMGTSMALGSKRFPYKQFRARLWDTSLYNRLAYGPFWYILQKVGFRATIEYARPCQELYKVTGILYPFKRGYRHVGPFTAAIAMLGPS